MQNNHCPSSPGADIPMGVLVKITEAYFNLRGKKLLRKDISKLAKSKDNANADGAVASTSASALASIGFCKEAQLAKVAVEAAAAIKNRVSSLYTEKFPTNMLPSAVLVSAAAPPLPNQAGPSSAGAAALGTASSGRAGSIKRSCKAIQDLRKLHDSQDNEFPCHMEVEDHNYAKRRRRYYFCALSTIVEENEEEHEEEHEMGPEEGPEEDPEEEHMSWS